MTDYNFNKFNLSYSISEHLFESESVSHLVMHNSVVPWTVAHRTSLLMKFSGEDYWSGYSFPSPEDLPNSGIKPGSPMLQADSLPSEPPEKPQIFT